ncbi:hypothetical protein TSOC_004845 [Tetrabaena socialis]|uniref:Uncharacterized protein n=1 Tax=Tetrabaena socialis TaxID=47790 RepID=A0A2J8A7U8_9CHLO|nr:hypothetical protein TSOC_004845 [Tetrabaena socialis]|eukprot:PNH08588.1 hypothetical protein TSOC_004845 [Tetrabaena socialis]
MAGQDEAAAKRQRIAGPSDGPAVEPSEEGRCDGDPVARKVRALLGMKFKADLAVFAAANLSVDFDNPNDNGVGGLLKLADEGYQDVRLFSDVGCIPGANAWAHS